MSWQVFFWMSQGLIGIVLYYYMRDVLRLNAEIDVYRNVLEHSRMCSSKGCPTCCALAGEPCDDLCLIHNAIEHRRLPVIPVDETCAVA